MKRLKLFVVFVALFMNLIPAVVTAPQSDPLSEIRWQKVDEWEPLLGKVAVKDASGAKIAEPQHSSAAEQQRSERIPPVLTVLNDHPQSPSPQSGTNQTSQNVDYQRESNEIQRRLATLTRWLVVVGFIQAAIILVQVSIGVRAANAAKEAANAAKSSADTAAQTLEITQRGRVAVEEWKFERHSNDTKDTVISRVECSLVNVGPTPVTLEGHYARAWDNPRSIEGEYRKFKVGDLAGMSIAREGHPLLIDLPKEMNVRNVLRGTQELYAFVYILYDDGFGHKRETGMFVRYDAQREGFVKFPDLYRNYST